MPPEIDADLRRVLVVGTSGAGKTHFAKRLAGLLDAPHVELDALFWLPGWVQRERADFKAQVRQAIAPERWVVDGNYSRVRPIVWPRATAVIWLNYSPLVVGWRAISRTIVRATTRQELFSGNRESFLKSFFSRDSILVWVFYSYRKNQRRYRALFKRRAYPNLEVIEFRKPAEAERFLREMEAR